jgi:hypothetical protein
MGRCIAQLGRQAPRKKRVIHNPDSSKSPGFYFEEKHGKYQEESHSENQGKM